MTTAHGVPTLKAVRGYASIIQNRVDYLAEKLADKIAARPDLQARLQAGEFDPRATFEGAEITALRYALDLIEENWDDLARLRRNLDRLDARMNGIERHLEVTGEEFDPRKARLPEWSTTPVEPVPPLRYDPEGTTPSPQETR